MLNTQLHYKFTFFLFFFPLWAFLAADSVQVSLTSIIHVFPFVHVSISLFCVKQNWGQLDLLNDGPRSVSVSVAITKCQTRLFEKDICNLHLLLVCVCKLAIKKHIFFICVYWSVQWPLTNNIEKNKKEEYNSCCLKTELFMKRKRSPKSLTCKCDYGQVYCVFRRISWKIIWYCLQKFSNNA